MGLGEEGREITATPSGGLASVGSDSQMSDVLTHSLALLPHLIVSQNEEFLGHRTSSAKTRTVPGKLE